MSIKNLIVGLLLLLLFARALAQENSAMVYAIGDQTCGEWSSYDVNSIPHTANKYWLAGFVTAAGLFTGKPLSPSTTTALSAWVNNYCQQNPLDEVSLAATKLIAELHSRAD